MTYFVSRQKYWDDGRCVVEIASGGLDYANPDMLVASFGSLGEGQEYTDPREAVEAGIAILRAWKKAGTRGARLAYGSTGGFTIPFEASTIPEARAWAERTWEKLPKCEHCGEALAKETWGHEFSDGHPFCSRGCADLDHDAYQGDDNHAS